MIGSVVNISGYVALGRVASRLLDGTGATLQALDQGRTGIDQIKAALTKLRDALQSARDQANAVPGRTALRPVVADVEQTADQPTFVTINGQPVQSGTITVSLGTRPLIVGYENVDRAPLAVGDALRTLASTVATLVSRVGAGGTGGLAADVAALLRDKDFATAVTRPDAAAIDSAIGRIDDTLAKADGLGLRLRARAAAAAQVDFGGLLLSAAPDAGAGAAGPARVTGDGQT